MRYRLVFICACLFLWEFVTPQTFFPKKIYPVGEFRNPLDIPMELVGNFGECRPNHFHSGLDIRTGGKENLQVHSLEDGFVSRITIKPDGFGNAIYITHPNGYTSVYAHLNQFFPLLEQHVRKQQYETKKWQQDLYFLPHQFPVFRGQLIAFSGNTGSSQGPHLHLEIRNTKSENPVNPLLFFTELKDTRPPVIQQIAVYNGHRSIYEQEPLLLPVINGKLKQDTIVVSSSSAYLGIVADDFMESAKGTLGIFEMRMYLDDQPYFAWQMDDISYDVTRYMNAFADYKTRINGGPWIQLCYQLPNNQLKVFKDFSTNKGMISFNSSNPRKITIEVVDTRNNRKRLTFYIKSKQRDLVYGSSQSFTPGEENAVRTGPIQCIFPHEMFYDHFDFSAEVVMDGKQTLYKVGEPYIPLHTDFNLYLKPSQPVLPALQSKMVFSRRIHKKPSSKKGIAALPDKDLLKAAVRDFGIYEIMVDTTAPLITTLLKDGTDISKMKRLYFVVKESMTTVQKCEAYVDDHWLRFVQKGDSWYYEIDDYFPMGSHTFTVKAWDENNNSRIMHLTLKR